MVNLKKKEKKSSGCLIITFIFHFHSLLPLHHSATVACCCWGTYEGAGVGAERDHFMGLLQLTELNLLNSFRFRWISTCICSLDSSATGSGMEEGDGWYAADSGWAWGELVWTGFCVNVKLFLTGGRGVRRLKEAGAPVFGSHLLTLTH